MNSLNTLITKIKVFYVNYKWFLFPLIPIIIFTFIIIYFFYAQKTPEKPPINHQNQTAVSTSPAQVGVSQAAQVSPLSEVPTASDNSYNLSNEVNDIAFGKFKINHEQTDQGDEYPGEEFAAGSSSQQALSDGSILYEYPSTDPNRPHMQIVKDDIPIFRRNIVPDATVSDYSAFLTNPPYTHQGSGYYGANAVILANPPSGIAVVYNPQTNQVYEQYIFQAVNSNDFVTKYGKDISVYQP